MYELPEFINSEMSVVIYGYGHIGHEVEKLCIQRGLKYFVCDKMFAEDNSIFVTLKSLQELVYDYIIISIKDGIQRMDVERTLLSMGCEKQKILYPILVTSHSNSDNLMLKLQSAITNLENRISFLESRMSSLGFNEVGGRVDLRLTRLEILQYYQNKQRYDMLDNNQKEIIQYLEEENLRTYPRKFPFDHGGKTSNEHVESNIVIDVSHTGGGIWRVNGKKVYLGGSPESAYRMADGLYREFFTDNPHRYLNPEKDGIDVPEGAVLADVGAAEGLFGLLFIDRIKKLYLFECEDRWIELLKKTYAPYMNKVEIVKGTVGDRPENIKLDDFFKNKEAPTFVKMDIEGYEPSALRGMKRILKETYPLTMLICTYHRQDDFDTFSQMLQDDFTITSSDGYFWHMPDPMPPFFRRGVLKAVKKTSRI